MHSLTKQILRILAALLLATLVLKISIRAQAPARSTEEQALQSFAAIHPIDTHVHVFKSDAAFQSMLEKLNLKLLNILVVDDTLSYRKQLQPQVRDALNLVRSSHGHVGLCTTFDPYKVADSSFVQDTIKQIDQDFRNGAIAVKLWKNVGMEIKDANGKYLMADDSKLQPIYQDIQSHGKTLLTHQAEPDVAWGPPDPADPSWSYYQENPQWYVGGKPGFPSKKTILDARDRVLERNPNLKMVGVHLGSMERSLDDIAQRLDRYPNFAIDTAARMEYLMLMPRDTVRSFLIKYQDRILYGTDLDLLADANVPEALKDWRSTYARDWRYFGTSETLTVNGKNVQGLELPKEVLQKIFRENARHWIPGI